MNEDKSKTTFSLDSLRHTESDWFLINSVTLIEVQDTQLDITVSLKGTLLTGLLISAKRYFQDFGVYLASGSTSIETAESIKKNYKAIGDYIHKEIVHSYSSGDLTPPLATHFHLADVKVVFGEGLFPKNGMKLWRGRINSIDGFSFSRLFI